MCPEHYRFFYDDVLYKSTLSIYLSLYTTVVYKTAENNSDDVSSYPPAIVTFHGVSNYKSDYISVHLTYEIYSNLHKTYSTDLFTSAAHAVPPRPMKPRLYVGLFVWYHLVIFNITLNMLSLKVCDKLLNILTTNHKARSSAIAETVHGVTSDSYRSANANRNLKYDLCEFYFTDKVLTTLKCVPSYVSTNMLNHRLDK